jgi:hypothetical protein
LEKERQEMEDVRSMEEYGLDRNVTFERYMDLDEVIAQIKWMESVLSLNAKNRAVLR